MIVYQGRQHIVRRRDRMKVPREMHIDVGHRDDLGIPSPHIRRPSFRNRAPGSARDRRPRPVLADFIQSVYQTDERRRLAFACRRRTHGGHQNELTLRFAREGRE